MENKKEDYSFLSDSVPSVINKELLIKSIIDQGPKGEAGRLFLEDGIEFDRVKEIRLEFHRILYIDYLWPMKNLVKLNLSNNVIEKIQGLESLVNLQELNVSFNHITKMENLGTLVKLQTLLLFSNKIKVIEGIDKSENLSILSIGKNEIGDREHALYLRQFKQLRSLNISGNPCTKNPGYFQYLIAFIPHLKYVDYKIISDSQRHLGLRKHFREINGLEEKESRAKEEAVAKKAEEDRIALLFSSFVEYLDDDYLFEKMFKNDKEGRELCQLNEDAEKALTEYREAFCNICYELYILGLEERIKRQDEIDMYREAVKRGIKKNQVKLRRTMNEITDRREEIARQSYALMDSMDADDIVETDIFEEKIDKIQRDIEDFNGTISKTWTSLVHDEVVLYEQLEDVSEHFKVNITELVETFLAAALGQFVKLRDAEHVYNENIQDIGISFINSFDDNKVPEAAQAICGDTDILSNNLMASHDVHLQVIDAREDVIKSRLREWLDDVITSQFEELDARHRQQILEISHFLEYQREQISMVNVLDAFDNEQE